MTQPDKWDEMARNILRNMSIPAPYFEMPLSDALRQAFAEGERAGMERAAMICEEKAKKHGWNYHLPSVGRELATAIHAAKETKA